MTRVLTADAEAVLEAAHLLQAGRLVAFPTETVYGLGANALSVSAVQGIFAAKGRPADDPLIVHLSSADALSRVAVANQMAERLTARFWPGPLTLVLPRRATVPLAVTAGLDTVGVRVPLHPVAMALLRAADLPVAAPSANLFGRPSPTRAEHVVEDLDGRVDLVLDGGPTSVGVESTIVDLSGARPRLLRPGGLPAEAIESVLGVCLEAAPTRPSPGPQLSPGLLSTHYAPRTPLVLILGSPEAARQRLLHELQRPGHVGVLLLDEDADLLPREVVAERVGSWHTPSATAERLFDALRRLDRRGLDRLYARTLADPQAGLGRALADRLRRAATHVIEA